MVLSIIVVVLVVEVVVLVLVVVMLRIRARSRSVYRMNVSTYLAERPAGIDHWLCCNYWSFLTLIVPVNPLVSYVAALGCGSYRARLGARPRPWRTVER